MPPGEKRCLHTRRFGTLASLPPPVDALPSGGHPNGYVWKFVEGDLPQEAGPWLVVPDLPYALVVVVSNGLSLGRAQEHVLNTRPGLGRDVLEKL